MPTYRESANRQFNNIRIQKYLPFELWSDYYMNGQLHKTDFSRSMGAGVKNLGELFRNPGGLQGNVAGAIAPRLAMESDSIGRNTRNIQQEAGGSLARAGMGGGPWAQALNAAIQQGGARQMADARRGAMAESEQLRRQDLSRVMDMYQLLLNFTTAGRNTALGVGTQSIQQGQINTQQQNQQQSGYLAALSAILGAFV